MNIEILKINESRMHDIDLAKFFAILIVVLGHSVQHYINDYSNTILRNFIWLIQMPLFMTLSGIVAKKPRDVDTMHKLLGRIIKSACCLLVPYFTFTFFSSFADIRTFPNKLIRCILHPNEGLWFLYVLFLLEFFFNLGNYLSSRIHFNIFTYVGNLIFSILILAILLVAFYLFGFDLNIIGLKLVIFYFPFFYLGFLISCLKCSKFYHLNNYKYIEFVFSIFSFVLYCFISIYFKNIEGFPDNNIFYLFIRILGSISSIISTLYVCKMLAKVHFFNRISTLGQYTLQIYYIHIIFNVYLNSYFLNVGIDKGYLLCFTTFAIIIVLSFFTLLVIYFIPFSHLLIFGKSFSPYKFEKDFLKCLKTNGNFK